jgi:hypothetical protein
VSTREGEMSDPKIFRVSKGRKVWSFKVPEQASNFYLPDNGGYLLIENEKREPIMIFSGGAWDTITVVRETGEQV